jgi:hypothetical protein
MISWLRGTVAKDANGVSVVVVCAATPRSHASGHLCCSEMLVPPTKLHNVVTQTTTDMFTYHENFKSKISRLSCKLKRRCVGNTEQLTSKYISVVSTDIVTLLTAVHAWRKQVTIANVTTGFHCNMQRRREGFHWPQQIPGIYSIFQLNGFKFVMSFYLWNEKCSFKFLPPIQQSVSLIRFRIVQ